MTQCRGIYFRSCWEEYIHGSRWHWRGKDPVRGGARSHGEIVKNWMTICLSSCDMNAIDDDGALHGKFASVNNRAHIAW